MTADELANHAMTERGMTELAASALGIYGVWCDERAAIIGLTQQPAGQLYQFAPRRSSEDAMHLALKLGIAVWRDGDVLWIDHKRHTLYPHMDMYDETRRLILCAAAKKGTIYG